MTDRVRRHHVVSRFYLQRFADAQGLVRQVWHPDGRAHLSSVSNVSVIKDFYTVKFGPKGSEQVSDYWEKEFSKIETPAAGAFSLALDQGEWPLPPKSRDALVSWLSLQHVRNESARMMISDLTAFHYRMIVGINGIARLRQVMESQLNRHVGTAELEAEWEDLTKETGPSVVGNANEHIESIQRLIGPISDHFQHCGLSLWKFERKALISGDHPVVLFGDPPFPGGGVGLSNAECAMIPMSRRVALRLAPADPIDYVAPGYAALARGLNAAVAATSARWFVAHPEDELTTLDVECHPVRTRAIPPPQLEGLVQRDRPIETTLSIAESVDESYRVGTVPLHYPAWPLPGRVFENPHAPNA